MIRGLTTLSIALLLIASPAVAEPNGLAAAEKAKIESLIAAVQNLDGAVFVRNGKTHDAATAAKFLRAKWRDRRDIRSAEDFIEKVATRSSTTGRAYLVRYADGREVPTAAFLRAHLQKLR